MKLCYLSANSLLLAGLFQVLHPNDIHILERFASRVQICSPCPLVSWLVFFRSDNIHLLFWKDSWKETENVLVGGIFAFLILSHRSHVGKVFRRKCSSKGQICLSYSLAPIIFTCCLETFLEEDILVRGKFASLILSRPIIFTSWKEFWKEISK